MVKSLAILALFIETGLAFPSFGTSGSLDYQTRDNNYGTNSEMAPQTNYFPASLTNFVYKNVGTPRGTGQYDDQSGFQTDSSQTADSVSELMSGANLLANNLVQRCIETVSIDNDELLDCLRRLLLDEQGAEKQGALKLQRLENNAGMDMKREPLKVNPTGWRRKKRHLTQKQLREQRFQRLVSILLNKRQKSKARFNPTGW